METKETTPIEPVVPLSIVIYQVPTASITEREALPPRPDSNFLDSPENRFRRSRFPTQQHAKALQDHVSVDSGSGSAPKDDAPAGASPTLTNRRDTEPPPFDRSKMQSPAPPEWRYADLPGQVPDTPGTPVSFSRAQQRFKGREKELDRALSDIGASPRSRKKRKEPKRHWFDLILTCGRTMQ